MLPRVGLLSILFLGAMCALLAGCGPFKVEKIEEIEPNETAFLINLEDVQGKSVQDALASPEQLEPKKIANKRVNLEQRVQKTGRFWFSYQWLPTQRVLRVNRKPVTREWTPESGQGKGKLDQAIYVESEDSIGFGVAINITVSVQERDAALYICSFGEKPLETVLDENIRGFVQTILSDEFGKKPLMDCIKTKKEVSELLLSKTKETFSEKGVTVEYMGLAEGLTFENPKIQEALDKKFTAEMDAITAKQELAAQEDKNKKTLSIAKAEQEAAAEFEKSQESQVAMKRLKIEQSIVEKWDGSFPANVVPADSPFIFSLPMKDLRTPVPAAPPSAPKPAPPAPVPAP